ncbi:hypothetical protein [Zavarzinia compransoris]|uniref:Uncharacterized protein n=1 Tax=Zavarzinia compransoris TaxID=1264899 RepID=A0A317E306_9PROT|nr:hypothetical protein [Zavarzinia compransoris]PWR20814.1 hypothetical protein DKG75_12545 [Zavarzinia compransoris]TDP44350.1 hypothetical protein DES42_107115 [Zavarzinia compransoris]
MTATAAAETNPRRLPVLLPGRRSELGKAEAEFFAPTPAGDNAGSGFAEFLDVINPLQHIPLVSTLYRELTGDTISPAARIVGGALYGGPIGAGVAIVGAVAEQVTGKTPEAQVMAALGLGGDGEAPVAVAAAPSGLIAEATTSPPAPAAAPAVPATTVAASAGMPQMSPAAFDALIRAVDAQPAEAAAAAPVATASAGTTEERRFFPARQAGVRAPRPVPMDIRAEDKASYDDALRLMRQNIERYTSAGIAAGGTGAAAP